MWNVLQRTRYTKIAVLLFAFIFCLYLPSFFNTFIWDDEQFIYKNLFTTSWSYVPQIFTTNTTAGAGVVSNYYRPLTTVTFLIDRMIWGLQPFGYHLTNTVLHASVVVLFFLLLLRLGFSKLQATAAVVVYGVHPLNTEAVTYINSRGDSLFAFWLLLGVLAFDSVLKNERWNFTHDGHTYGIGRWWLAGIAVSSFAISVLSKEIAVAGIGIYGLIALWRWSKKTMPWKWALGLGSLLSAMLVTYFGLRLTVLNFSNSLNFYQIENEYSESLVIRMQTFGRILCEYFRLIAIPYPLHMEREVAFVTTPISMWVALSLVGVFGWMALSVWEWRTKQTWLIGFGGLWFFGMLAPVSGIVPINGLLYEHWLYLPLMGFLIALVGVWKLIPVRKIHILGRWLVIPFVVIFAVLTVRQNWIWRHPIPFYTYTLEHSQTARVYNNLAMAYADEGNHLKAIEYYEKGLTISNVYPQIYYNLARNYQEIGETKLAIENAQMAIRIDPSFLYTYSLLIDLYLNEKNYVATLPLYEVLLKYFPNDLQVSMLYGQSLWMTGQTQAADQVWNLVYQKSNSDPRVLQTVTSIKQSTQPQAQPKQ